MPGRCLQVLLVVACAALDHGVAAGQYLVVSRSSGGSWSFQEVESITVNGKDKIRSAPLASSNPTAWDAKSINHLAEVQFSSFAIVRRAAEGSILGRAAATGLWQLLLPQKSASRDAESPARLWTGSTIALKKDHKDKTGSAIRAEDVFAILPGPDAAASAAALATDLSFYKLPGVSDADAFSQMLALLPDAVKAFPSPRVREFLETGLSDRLKTWHEGDAPITVLNDALALAKASDAAFPKDAALAQLSEHARAARKWLDRRVAILRALDAGRQSDPFLVDYRDFEIYDKSFPQLAEARLAHLHASAAAHLETARTLQRASDYGGAIRHLLIAKWRDPNLKKADDVLEQVRLEAARLSAQKFAESRRGIDPRSPAQVQVQRRLLLAEQYLNDGKAPEAEKALQEAETIDKDEPRITLLQARLSVVRGDLGKALALLDNFAGIALTPEEFAEGEKLRASVQYNIETTLGKKRADLTTDLDQQHFATALEAAADGLKLDNENPDFLFYAGANACVLRHCDKAAPLLRRFLDLTDSAGASRKRRIAAIQMLRESLAAEASTANAAARPPAKSELSWFSGAALGTGVFYDPVSLSFQPKVARIDASEHLTVTYEWTGAQLHSVHAKYEEKKTASNIMKLAGAAAGSAGGISSTVSWRTPDRETNDFYFNYYDDAPQVMKISRDNVVVKSRRIPISIPGVGMFGPFAGIGAMGALGSIGSIGAMSKLGGLGGIAAAGKFGGMGAVGGFGAMGGLGGLPGLGGFGGAGVLSRLAGAGRMSGLNGLSALAAARQFTPSQTYSVVPDPQGGSSAGFLTLFNSPRLDTRLAYKATGKRAAVGFAGNSYFHPFVWDGIHLFEFDYDEQGRVLHAWELDNPGAPRLDFTWDGQKLMKITGRDSSPAASVVYSRTLNYSGDKLVSETISHQGATSHIEYKYDKQGNLLEADCDQDRSLDGRSRKVHFLLDNGKGKR